MKTFFSKLSSAIRYRITATTGSAAALIGGSTIHKAVGISVKKKAQKNDLGITEQTSYKDIQTSWKYVRLLTIDEVSMMGRTLLMDIDEKLRKIYSNEDKPFGGVNINFAGDFYQLPPVKQPALYYGVKPRNVNIQLNKFKAKESLVDGCLWKNTKYAVLLNEQQRINLEDGPNQLDNLAYMGFLTRLRKGECNDEDIKLLRSRTIGDPLCSEDIFDSRWLNAFIIVTRNCLRFALNFHRVNQIAKDKAQDVFVVAAEDKFTDKASEDIVNRVLNENDENKTGRLCSFLYLTIGMRIIIRSNVYTELGICNGTIGTIKSIVFDQRSEGIREIYVHDQGVRYIPLKHMPIAVVITLQEPAGRGSLHSKLSSQDIVLKPESGWFEFDVSYD